jgi:hypothetical protein
LTFISGAAKNRKHPMSGTDAAPMPIIELKADEDKAPAISHALERRIRQQEILAELGREIDGRGNAGRILQSVGAQSGRTFLVRAGVGWEPGIVGVATIGADLASPAGFALRTGKPVISNHLENEERFRTPELLVKHGIRRAMNVILQGDGNPR